jgi:KUP system potassium uptake protein
VVIITALFALQVRGTSGIGKVFGPILIAWFLVISVLGARQIAGHLQILQAFNPLHGLLFLRHIGLYRR